jgi:alkanesulfonate monooxygenase SsuD/methylene tetrahydromethanopterin reductase-like flavin-dependent oxidoreductase (luciferase family)
MLPNYPSLVVAEQFAMLEALHPGRIDLGIGRAPGTDPATAVALRRAPQALNVDEFPRYLLDLMGLLGDRRGSDGLWTRFAATPVAESKPEIVLLGSSGYSAQLAGQLQALALYHQNFTPSPVLDRPHAIVTANVLVAPTAEEAAWLAASGQLMTFAIRRGQFIPLLPPEEANVHPNLPLARQMPSNRIVGTPEEVVAELEGLVEVTAANELMVFSAAYGIENRVRSLELLAEAWQN